MAKVSFTKFGLKTNADVKIVDWNDELSFEVKQYLPIEERATLISNVVNYSVDDNGFYNPIKLDLFTTLEIMYYYTNINFTDKMKSDPSKLYDLVVGNGLYDLVVNNIPKDEYYQINESIYEAVDSIYKYRNSAMGLVDNFMGKYSDLGLNIEELQSKLANGENVEFLKEVLDKLG